MAVIFSLIISPSSPLSFKFKYNCCCRSFESPQHLRELLWECAKQLTLDLRLWCLEGPNRVVFPFCFKLRKMEPKRQSLCHFITNLVIRLICFYFSIEICFFKWILRMLWNFKNKCNYFFIQTLLIIKKWIYQSIYIN